MKIKFLAFFLFISSFCFSQNNKVFIIGENEVFTDSLAVVYDNSLFSVCDNDFNEAQEAWLSLLLEMEAYADEIKFDIKGLKFWSQIYWDGEGKIQHIGFYLKPESRFIKQEDIKAFFSSFIKNYRFPKITKKKFSHTGNVVFPIAPQIYGQ